MCKQPVNNQQRRTIICLLFGLMILLPGGCKRHAQLTERQAAEELLQIKLPASVQDETFNAICIAAHGMTMRIN